MPQRETNEEDPDVKKINEAFDELARLRKIEEEKAYDSVDPERLKEKAPLN